jgi:hypothetical protein
MKALAVLPLVLGMFATPVYAQALQGQQKGTVTFNGNVFDAPPPQGGWYGQAEGYRQPPYPGAYPQARYTPAYPQASYAPGYPQTAYTPGAYGQPGYGPPGAYRQAPTKAKTYHHVKRHVRYKSSAS